MCVVKSRSYGLDLCEVALYLGQHISGDYESDDNLLFSELRMKPLLDGLIPLSTLGVLASCC